MMRKPHSASLVLLLICIFAFWWGISVLSQSTIPVPVATSTSNTGPQVALTTEPLMVHETIKGHVYTYSGTFKPRSTCDSFGSGIRYTPSDGGHVTVLLIAKPSAVACAQAAEVNATEEPFTVSITVATINPVFDGVLLNETVIPSKLVTGN